MSRIARKIEQSEEEIGKVRELSRSKKAEARLVERAKMVCGCLEGKKLEILSKELGVTQYTIRTWRNRFIENGIDGLNDRARSGHPIEYGEEFEKSVLETLQKPVPNGYANWDGPLIAEYLHTSVYAVWRFLKKKGVSLCHATGRGV